MALWACAAILLAVGVLQASGAPSQTVADLAAASNENPGPTVQGVAGPDGEVAEAPQGPAQTSLREQGEGGLDTPLLPRLRSVLGMLLLGGIAWAFSVDRSNLAWRVVLWGIGLQLIFAFFILKTPLGAGIFDWLNTVVVSLLGFTVEGARFIFGDLVYNNVPVGLGEAGSNAPIQEVPGQVARTGASFAFNVLPTIIFFSSLMTVLYHVGVMQWVVRAVAWVMQKTLHTSGAETLSAAGNIFVGQTEAPLMIKPFFEKMTMSELHAVMTGGFATVAGGVLAAYVGMLVAYFPDIAGHLIAASVMSAPAALVMAKLMYPEDGEPVTKGQLKIELESPDVNVIDAASRGAGEGLGLALNVGAMLLAFIALIAMANALLGWGGSLVGLEGLSFQQILGWILAPLAWFMGVPWVDAVTVGSLLGIKTVVNEFVAYLELSSILQQAQTLQPRSVIISIYALSGFANFSSIAIQLGGIGGLAPSRRHDLSKVGFRAMVAGSLAAFMTATVAGMLL
ncbi:MAG: NupC/NupG family nucleoside CNT transporter [Gemmatimonadetes bacterium]|nr:NupC/NupG family nucleoside CNT transporter [Gemmatimonadota bacterium]NNM05648.1 NupC/NupG family nucleoside CNT transporter [Gemmatimonadota bacterium]